MSPKMINVHLIYKRECHIDFMNFYLINNKIWSDFSQLSQHLLVISTRHLTVFDWYIIEKENYNMVFEHFFPSFPLYFMCMFFKNHFCYKHNFFRKRTQNW